jgi:peptide/nickel transport system permease protein
MERGETYWDIVWRQFRRNRFAYVSLWSLVPVVAVAIFAPLLSSNVPLVFRTPDGTFFPWLRGLFHPDEPVDFVFNMALLGFPLWLLSVLIRRPTWKRRGLTSRVQVLHGVFGYVVITLALTAVFAVPALRPNNRFRASNFPVEEFAAPETKHATYVLIPFGPFEQDVKSRFEKPLYRKPQSSWEDSNDGVIHPLGTDDSGRDVLTRMIYGTRLAITVGFAAVSIYLTIGCIVGALAGYFGGWVDILISRVVEIVMLFPAFFLILTLVALMGPSIYIIMGVIGVTSWPSIARLIRGEVLKQRAADYVSAAQALGFSHARIIFRHLLPNSLTPALVAAPFGIAGAIITEAGLSLLGFGVRPPAPTWGSLLHLAHHNYSYWWLVVFPSLAIFFTVTIFNLIGGGLRDAMDPRLRATE